jgi:hypothetical protein
MSTKRMQLQSAWCQVFDRFWQSSCRIRFGAHWLNKLRTPCATINASCSYGECSAIYKLTVNDFPKSGEDVCVNVKMDGVKFSEPHAYRQVRGTDRAKIAAALKGVSATEFRYRQLATSQMPQQSSVVLRKISSEDSLKERNHVDPWSDLDLEADKQPLYVQFIGKRPLMLHLYFHESLVAYSQFVKGATLHFDSTGGIVKHFSSQMGHKRIYYYAIILKTDNVSFPVAECITDTHSVPDVYFFVSKWLYALDKKNCTVPLPNCVVVDHSFCLLHVCAMAFTKCNSIWQYISTVFDCLERNIPSTTPCMFLCCAHLVKEFARVIKKCALVQQARDFIIRCLCCFFSFTSLNTAISAAKHFFVILLSNSRVHAEASVNFFRGKIEGQIDDVIINNTDETTHEDIDSRDTSLHRRSPFYRVFHESFLLAEDNADGDIFDINPFRDPTIAKVLLDKYFSIAPLWMPMLFGQVRRTNGAVESWFNITKSHIMQHRHPISLASFVRLMKPSVLGRIRESLQNNDIHFPAVSQMETSDILEPRACTTDSPAEIDIFETVDIDIDESDRIPSWVQSSTLPHLSECDVLDVDCAVQHSSSSSSVKVPPAKKEKMECEKWKRAKTSGVTSKYFSKSAVFHNPVRRRCVISHVVFPNGCSRLSLDGVVYRLMNTCTIDNFCMILFHAYTEVNVLQQYISAQNSKHARDLQFFLMESQLTCLQKILTYTD